jgi:hypothetical protein
LLNRYDVEKLALGLSPLPAGHDDQTAKAMPDEEMQAEIEDFLEGFNQPTQRGIRIDGERVHTWSNRAAGVAYGGRFAEVGEIVLAACAPYSCSKAFAIPSRFGTQSASKRILLSLGRMKHGRAMRTRR